MHVIVGLGNPGETYQHTRHNVGYMVVDRLSQRTGGTFSKGKGSYFLSKISLSHLSTPVMLVKPTTYMNLSGQAVRKVMDYYQITDLSRVLIILDDLSLPFGTLRLKPMGGAAGQNGLKSIIEHLKTNEIPRLRVGIGNQNLQSGIMPRHFVLSTFNNSEKKNLSEMVEWAADTAISFVQNGAEMTMNEYNKYYLNDTR